MAVRNVAEVNQERRTKYNTLKNTYKQFPVGTRVQVICVAQDFAFFNGEETGTVTKNTGDYLGIIVTFDKKYAKYRPNFNFEPKDLIALAFDYLAALAERDALQAELDKIYAKAGRVQEQYNVIDDKINAYEQEQRALDE